MTFIFFLFGLFCCHLGEIHSTVIYLKYQNKTNGSGTIEEPFNDLDVAVKALSDTESNSIIFLDDYETSNYSVFKPISIGGNIEFLGAGSIVNINLFKGVTLEFKGLINVTMKNLNFRGPQFFAENQLFFNFSMSNVNMQVISIRFK